MAHPAPSSFWRGKRVLLTGHTGFKGAWLALWLNRLGADVTAVSLAPAGTPNLFSLAGIGEVCNSLYCDIRDAAALATHVTRARPEVVLHLAAQSLVRPGYREPRATFETNVMGTVNLLDALRGLSSVRVAVLITTDKVYRNHEWVWPYRETDALGGHDPYSASKAASEIAIDSYRGAFFAAQGVAIASCRAGNVIGGGDWSEDRVIPDAVRAWQSGSVLQIRRPDSVRPWQHVLDPLAGYLQAAERLWGCPELQGAYNFGPDPSGTATVRQLIDLARSGYGRGDVSYAEQVHGPHEAGLLSLDNAKARAVLGVSPRWELEQAVSRTMLWYRAHHDGANALSLCEQDIAAFEAAR